MPLHVQRGLAFIGFGLLLEFFGLIFIANLLGVMDEYARSISRRNQWLFGIIQTPDEVKRRAGFRSRHVVGTGFMLVGPLAIGGGGVYVVAPSAE